MNARILLPLLVPLALLAPAALADEPCASYCGGDPQDLAWFLTHHSSEGVDDVFDAYAGVVAVTGVACDPEVGYVAWTDGASATYVMRCGVRLP